jgi:hypothetical protein
MHPRPAPAPARPTVSAALRAMEALLLHNGQRRARSNAWTAVLEDRRRARDRHEAAGVLDSLAAPAAAGAAEA